MAFYNTNKLREVYLSNSVETQSQGKLMIMLYDGAIRFIDNAKEAIEKRETELVAMRRIEALEEIHSNIIKAQNIILEFRKTLVDDGGELFGQLDSLYAFLYSELVSANYNKNGTDLTQVKETLEHVKKSLSELRSTWIEVM